MRTVTLGFCLLIGSSLYSQDAVHRENNIINEKAVVIAGKKSGLMLMKRPSRNSEKLTVIPYSTIIDVIEIGQPDNVDPGVTWFRIKYKKFSGWAYGADIDFNISEPHINYITGTFKFFEAGDYYHIVIKNANGTDQSFWLYDTDLAKIKPLDPDNPEINKKYTGKKIRIEWYKTKKWIPEGGSIYILDNVKSIVILE